MTSPRKSRSTLRRVESDIAYVDPQQPGIVRFYDSDSLDGLLAGTRAQLIVDALNAHAAAKAKRGRGK